MEQEKKVVYIFDSYGLIYRSYYAFVSRPLTFGGVNISAVFGFFRNLLSVLKTYKSEYMVAAFDSVGPTFRHKMYPEYKATRAKTPEDLHAQVPMIKEILQGLGVAVLQKEGFEADDIIATVAKRCSREGFISRIVTGDKDLQQLADENCQILKPNKASGGYDLCTAKQIKELWSVEPGALLDLLSLWGDTADNVPGVKGIGEKIAKNLIAEYGSLDNIFSNVQNIKGAVGKKLQEGKESAYFSKKLITLESSVPLEYTLQDFSTKAFDYRQCANLLEKYGCPSVAKDFLRLAKIDDKGATKSDISAINDTRKQKKQETAQDTQEQKQNSIPIKQNKGDYKTITTQKQLQDFVDECLKKGLCAYDSETTGLDTFNDKIVGFSLCHTAGEGVYVPLSCGGDLFSGDAGLKKEVAFSVLEGLFNNKDMTVVLHNAKFDIKVLYSQGFKFSGAFGQPCCHLVDTMVAAWLLFPDAKEKGSYSLSGLCQKHLGLKGIEFFDVVQKGGTFCDVPQQKATDYAAEDADFTFMLWQKLKCMLEKEKLFSIFCDIEMKLLPILCSMELFGIHLDKKLLEDYGTELASSIKDLQNKIYSLVGHPFNIASTKQLQDVLFKELKLPATKKNKTGFSCDNEVLEELKPFSPVLQVILDYRALYKLLSTYVEPLPALADRQSRVHPSFVQTGTATGRLSCREPNLQNIPVRDAQGRRIRAAFTAPKGKVLISADYSQIELVVLSHISGDKTLQKAFQEGKDIHKATAALIFSTQEENITHEQRQIAKTINFGVIYGMSAFRLSGQLKISRGQAQSFIDSYFATYPTLKDFINKTIQQAQEKGFVTTMFSRKRQIKEINSQNKTLKLAAQRVALNTPIQGSAADIVKIAMIKVSDALQKAGEGAKILLQVHDELILECADDKDTIAKVVAIVKQNMEGAVKLDVPLKVSIEVGTSWGQFH